MNQTININSKELVILVNKLESLNKKSLPYAIRQSLNDASFLVKSKVPQEAGNLFKTRNKGFFKMMIVVKKTNSLDINSMRSEVGVNSSRLDKAASGLEAQELGGSISNRVLIPMTQARVSESDDKQVKKINYSSNIRVPKTKRKGTGTGYVILGKNKKTIFRTDKRKGLVPLYSINKKTINLKEKPFMRNSTQKSINQVNKIFIDNINKQIMRLK